MRLDVAIIGGTGVAERLPAKDAESFIVETPFGALHGQAIVHRGLRIGLISRHSAGHKVPPHRVNYRAIAAGLKELQVRGCLSSAAVGSLRPDWSAGVFVAVSDFLDFSNRQLTMFDDQVVHTDFSHPFSETVRAALMTGASELGIPLNSEGVYVCTNGPRYETPHEVRVYRQLGGDVVGMTVATEAILCREVGIPYGCLAIVTNLACGITDQPLSHEEVTAELDRSGERAVALLLAAATAVGSG